ncbi:MAG: hypothetical protein HYW89_04270 [Candidatus Sungiibacteriota bacterium]|uniref:Uncharacterized protein n=1 Tax=Candidatus Sungiibacteriota bacterium TaxID=2750080 RepID=A0A7T5UPS9_9BACT|nr:MAG: hypothetical protein HYW89_04270 [Candidatus Sungbacteria bacterium]
MFYSNISRFLIGYFLVAVFLLVIFAPSVDAAVLTLNEAHNVAALSLKLNALRNLLDFLKMALRPVGLAQVSSACTASLITLLGDGCHWMSTDSAGNAVYCDGPMTKSAKAGDTVTTTGCGAYSGTGTGGTTTTTTSSCSASLTALLGTGCHYMFNNSSGQAVYCDGPMTKSAKEGDTATTSGCSSTTTTTTTSSCSSSLTALLGTGCHYMFNNSSGQAVYCDGPMTKSAKEGDTATTSGWPPTVQPPMMWNLLGMRTLLVRISIKFGEGPPGAVGQSLTLNQGHITTTALFTIMTPVLLSIPLMNIWSRPVLFPEVAHHLIPILRMSQLAVGVRQLPVVVVPP